MDDETRTEKRKRVSSERKVKTFVKQIIDARSRWLEIVQSKKIRKRKLKKQTDRGKTKELYYVKPGSWWDEIQDEINEYKAQIKQYKKAKLSLPLPRYK